MNVTRARASVGVNVDLVRVMVNLAAQVSKQNLANSIELSKTVLQ